MTGPWQGAVAAGVAVGLHLAGFAFVPAPGGVQAAGDGGTAPITLAATDAGVAAMVMAWEAPPVVADAPAAPVMSDAPAAPAIPAAEVAPAMPNSMALTQPVLADRAPQFGDAPAPLPQVKPKSRPAQQAAVAKPKPAGAGTRAQVAAGTGGGVQAGSGGQASTGTLTGAGQADAKAAWGATIRAKIERKKRYPAGSTATGSVKLRLTVGTDGRLQTLSILRSSGDTALDAAAVKAVQAAGRFPRAPDGMEGGANFTLNISFQRQ
jgi:periplasmic protein TonB